MAQSEIFTSLRSALETTRGTGVNPTRILEQTDFQHTPDDATVRPPERRGSFFPYYRAAPGRETNALTFSGNLSYQQAAWLGNVAILGIASGTGAGADKTYAFIPASATDNVKAATLEFGYDTTLSASQPGYRLVYCVLDEMTLTFDKASAEGVTFAANMHSPKPYAQLSAFGGTPTALTTNAVTPTQVAVYIDAATIGTTLDQYVTTAEFTLTNEWTDLDTLNQTTAAQDTFRVGGRAFTLAITRYKINDTEAEFYASKAVRKVRIKATGPVLGSSNHSITIDCYGVWTGFDNTAVDGLIMETLTLEGVYDATATTDFRMDVVTDTTTIT